MADIHTSSGPGAASAEDDQLAEKPLTIGVVCEQLQDDFPDISISKIRYLEDQKLLTPHRSQGGYRLYTMATVDRLRTILRLQRDEFLPLRVIRQQLATGRVDTGSPAGIKSSGADAGRRATITVKPKAAVYTLETLLSETGASSTLVGELEEFGVIKGELRDGVRCYDEAELEIVRAVTELARYGVAGRNLRVFRTSADREAALLEQILAPSLRSRNPDRRKEAIETLESLATITTHLKHLLLIRDLRLLVS